MSFLQFAFNNVGRNARAYFAYFLSSAFMVMIFFTYAMFIFHPGISESEIGRMTRVGMQVAEYIIFIFSFLFVLYSISSFLKARSKEFGILTILGASSGAINRLIFLENMLIGAISIITGIAGGLLLSKLFLMLSTTVTGMGQLAFYWPFKAMVFTAVAFLILFIFLSLFTLLFIRKNRVLELLGGSSKPKREPKTSWWLVLLCIVLLTGAVILLNKGEKIGNFEILFAAAMGIAGTYFFYTQLAVFLVKLSKKNRRLLWRGTNLLWISEMAYKIKDNARMLFMVTVAISLACMSVGVILSINAQNEKMYAGDPIAMTYRIYEPSDMPEDLNLIHKELSAAGVSYDKVSMGKISTAIVGGKQLYTEIASVSDYNKLSEVIGTKPVSGLHNGQVTLLYSEEVSPERELLLNNAPIKLEEPFSLNLRIADARSERLFGSAQGNSLLVVTDEDFSELKGQIPQDRKYIGNEVISYIIKEWDRSKVPGLQDSEIAVTKKIRETLFDRLVTGKTENFFSARGESYAKTKEGVSLFSFVGVFIAAIFSISSASFLYFKLYSELSQDRRMYHSLSKIGLGDREMKFSSSLQIALLFFVPVLISGIQTFVVLSLLGNAFGLGEVIVPVLTATGTFLAAQLLYFAVVRSRYVIQLKRVMV